ncbi:hypothetical protein VTI28DRAFT_7894 [Corynascus sepedonium]
MRTKRRDCRCQDMLGLSHRFPEEQLLEEAAASSNGHSANHVADWLRSSQPLAARPFWDKANSHAARWSLGGVTPTCTGSFLTPLREPPQPIFPLSSPLLPVVSGFENPSHFPLSLPLQLIDQHRARAIGLRSLQQDSNPIHLAKSRLLQPLVDIYFHDHITNEQRHDPESARHTLNPTGARERARSQAISTIVL